MTLTSAPTTVQHVHQTPLGTMISTWTEAGLYSLQWDETSLRDGEVPMTNDMRAMDLDVRLCEYFERGNADFDSIELDSHGWTPFTEAVYQCCRAIAAGTTVTYKELAGRAGSDNASRAVGAAMSRNRVLLVIPCHRVVSAGGGLRGFSAPGGLQTKQYLLDLESE